MHTNPMTTLLTLNNGVSDLELQDKEALIVHTLEAMKHYIEKQTPKETVKILLSTQNYLKRASLKTNEHLPLSVGDLCYIDFGQAYLNEAGYQHFGLILSMMNGKAFVIPMTSNPMTYDQAYDKKTNPSGKIHLMRIGQLKGLNRPSVLFINDSKFINTTRIIEVKGHLDVTEFLFERIRRRVFHCIFDQ